MVTISDEAAILTAIVAAIGAIFVFLQVRHMEKHRNVDVSMKLFEWGEAERLRKAFKWIEKDFQFEDYGRYKVKAETSFELSDYPYVVTAFFEQIGFLVEKKFVDLDVIVDRLGAHIILNWKKLEHWIMALRKEEGDETFGEHFQKLYEKTVNQMKRR